MSEGWALFCLDRKIDDRKMKQAVIERGMTADMRWGLLPGVFIAIGVGGFLAQWAARRKAASAHGGEPNEQAEAERK